MLCVFHMESDLHPTDDGDWRYKRIENAHNVSLATLKSWQTSTVDLCFRWAAILSVGLRPSTQDH